LGDAPHIQNPMDASELAKLVNRSGFLFQLAVEEHVHGTSATHGWNITAREYPWSSPSGDRGGFVDFIAQRGGLHAVVECKRTLGGDWIFLMPVQATDTVKLRTLWSYRNERGRRGYGWDDLDFEPAGLVSEFCVVRGASDDDKPMLERIAGDLVRASESVAREELETKDRGSGAAGFIPLIVTNARRVDIGAVDLRTGSLPSTAVFEPTPVVRFRKATASDVKYPPETYASLREGLVKKERSAIVVNVEHLAVWLGAATERSSGVDVPRRPWAHFEP